MIVIIFDVRNLTTKSSSWTNFTFFYWRCHNISGSNRYWTILIKLLCFCFYTKRHIFKKSFWHFLNNFSWFKSFFMACFQMSIFWEWTHSHFSCHYKRITYWNISRGHKLLLVCASCFHFSCIKISRLCFYLPISIYFFWNWSICSIIANSCGYWIRKKSKTWPIKINSYRLSKTN